MGKKMLKFAKKIRNRKGQKYIGEKSLNWVKT